MRAMLVSFAAYHLWLDPRQFGPHLARQFTDYEDTLQPAANAVRVTGLTPCESKPCQTIL